MSCSLAVRGLKIWYLSFVGTLVCFFIGKIWEKRISPLSEKAALLHKQVTRFSVFLVLLQMAGCIVAFFGTLVYEVERKIPSACWTWQSCTTLSLWITLTVSGFVGAVLISQIEKLIILVALKDVFESS